MQSPYSINANSENAAMRGAADDASRHMDAGWLAQQKQDQLVNKLGDWYMMMRMIHGSQVKITEGANSHHIEIASSYNEYQVAEYDNEINVIKPAQLIDHAGSKITLFSHPEESISMSLSDGTSIIAKQGNISILASGCQLVIADGKVSIAGDLHISGAVHADNVISSKVDLNTHVHDGVTPGSSQSQPPMPSGSDPELSGANQLVEALEADDIRINQVIPEYLAAHDQDASDAMNDLSMYTPLLYMYDGASQLSNSGDAESTEETGI